MCSVVGCDSFRRSAHRFKLPEDPERRLEWVQFIFEVNKQRFKESSWTDITVCREHFTEDCFVKRTRTGSVRLKPDAVPSMAIKSEPEEPEEPDQESVETKEPPSQCHQLRAFERPTSCEEKPCTLTAAAGTRVPSDTSDSFVTHYGQMLQKVANIDIIREKAALLRMKGKYVVNEKQLLKLFTLKCPLCGSKVKVEKVVHGVLVILNQQCLQCDYRNQWKSQVNAHVPAAEDKHLPGDKKVISETVPTDDTHSSVTGVSEIVAVVNEESDPMADTEESSDEGDMGSDEDWTPEGKLLLANDDSDTESADDLPSQCPVPRAAAITVPAAAAPAAAPAVAPAAAAAPAAAPANPFKGVPVVGIPGNIVQCLHPIGVLNGQLLYEIVSPAPPLKAPTSKKRKRVDQQDDKRPYVKKPPNAFMLFLKEQRPSVAAELNVNQSAVVNAVLGERWKSLSKEQQAKYYEQAEIERRLHAQQYPEWSSSNNYGKKVKRKRERKVLTGFQMSASEHGETQREALSDTSFGGALVASVVKEPHKQQQQQQPVNPPETQHIGVDLHHLQAVSVQLNETIARVVGPP